MSWSGVSRPWSIGVDRLRRVARLEAEILGHDPLRLVVQHPEETVDEAMQRSGAGVPKAECFILRLVDPAMARSDPE
jgi:hypothetical protein